MGFIVNYLMLTILFHLLGISIVISQIISAEMALLATFIGNNFWAFKNHHHISVYNKLIKFHVSGIAGLFINSSLVITLVNYLHLYYGFALVIGSLVALIWNFTLYKHFVFKQPKINIINQD